MDRLRRIEILTKPARTGFAVARTSTTATMRSTHESYRRKRAFRFEEYGATQRAARKTHRSSPMWTSAISAMAASLMPSPSTGNSGYCQSFSQVFSSPLRHLRLSSRADYQLNKATR